MSLIKQWEDIANEERTQEDFDNFWNTYFEKEKAVYETLLSGNINTIKGTLSELAAKYNMSNIDFAGFMSGINTSLTSEIDIDALEEESAIDVTIDFEKLYYNMHVAQADWLFSLPQWDGILSVEKRKELKAAYNSTKTVVKGEKIGRNDPCPCGSGKKYKKCCGK